MRTIYNRKKNNMQPEIKQNILPFAHIDDKRNEMKIKQKQKEENKYEIKNAHTNKYKLICRCFIKQI